MVKNHNQFLSFILLLLISPLGWSWTGSVIEKRPIPKMGEYIQYQFLEPKHFPVTVNVVLLEAKKYSASLFVQQKKEVKSLMMLSVDKKAKVAINGGFYRENFLPNGLLIVKGKRVSRFVSNRLLAALVQVDKNGAIQLLKKSQSYEKTNSVFQAGPILLEGQNVYNNGSDTLRQRSVIVEFKSGVIGLLSFSPVPMRAAAILVKKISDILKMPVKLAVNLDGGVASSFVVNFMQRPVIVPEREDVKMALLFNAKEG